MAHIRLGQSFKIADSYTVSPSLSLSISVYLSLFLAVAMKSLVSLLLLLLLSQAPQQIASSAVLISDMTMTMMVELSSRHPFCKMHTDR